MTLLHRMAGRLTGDEYRRAIQYRALVRAVRRADGVIRDAEFGRLLANGPTGAHATPWLYADRIEWNEHVVPLSKALSAKIIRLKKAVIVPSDQLSDSDEARTFQLELRIENPDFAAGFIEEYKTEHERDLERFCQQVNLAMPGGEVARTARWDAVARTERDRDLWAEEAEPMEEWLESLSTRKALGIRAWARLPDVFVREIAVSR